MEEKFDEYFTSVNFLCQNIIAEKKNFQSLLGQQWSALPSEEQNALLDEHFVPPHIQQIYSGSDEPEEVPDFFPRLKLKSGQKVVEDDEVEQHFCRLEVLNLMFISLMQLYCIQLCA